MSFNDELVSQFLAFTGSSDTDQAASYLEMCGGELETAVGMFLEHQGGTAASGAAASAGGGSPGFGPDGGGGMDDIRAPDATRTMRLMDEVAGPSGMMFGMVHPYSMQMNHQPMMGGSAFARDVVNRAAAASARRDVGDEMDHDYGDGDDDDDDTSEDRGGGAESPPRWARRAQRARRAPRAPSGRDARASSLADMFAPPSHLIYKEGGFEGARTMAKDNKRWLLVNLQSDAEFSCHALNRDVWRDELVENLIREGFIFWQDVSLCWSTLMEAMSNHFSVRGSLVGSVFDHFCICQPADRWMFPLMALFIPSGTMFMIIPMLGSLTLVQGASCGRRRVGHSRIHSLPSSLRKWRWIFVLDTPLTGRLKPQGPPLRPFHGKPNGQ